MLKDLEKAQKLLSDAYEIVVSVKEQGVYSDGKSDILTTEALLFGDEPEDILNTILGLR